MFPQLVTTCHGVPHGSSQPAQVTHPVHRLLTHPHTTPPPRVPLLYKLRTTAPHSSQHLAHSSHISAPQSPPRSPHDFAHSSHTLLTPSYTATLASPRCSQHQAHRAASGRQLPALLPAPPRHPHVSPLERVPSSPAHGRSTVLRASQQFPPRPQLHTLPHTAPHTVPGFPALHTVPTASTHLLGLPRVPPSPSQGHVFYVPRHGPHSPTVLQQLHLRCLTLPHRPWQLPRASLIPHSCSHCPVSLSLTSGAPLAAHFWVACHGTHASSHGSSHTSAWHLRSWACSSQILVWPLSFLLTSPKPVPSPHANQALRLTLRPQGCTAAAVALPARSALHDRRPGLGAASPVKRPQATPTRGSHSSHALTAQPCPLRGSPAHRPC